MEVECFSFVYFLYCQVQGNTIFAPLCVLYRDILVSTMFTADLLFSFYEALI